MKWVFVRNYDLDATGIVTDITGRKTVRHNVFVGKLVRGKTARRPEHNSLMRGIEPIRRK